MMRGFNWQLIGKKAPPETASNDMFAVAEARLELSVNR
jgi:hypothetical protein